MQKVVGSSPIIRFEAPAKRGCLFSQRQHESPMSPETGGLARTRRCVDLELLDPLYERADRSGVASKVSVPG